MRKIRIGTKIIFGYISILLISSALVAFLAFLLFSINNISVFLAEDAIPLMDQTSRLERALARINLDMRSYYYSQNERFYLTSQSSLEDVATVFKDMDLNLTVFNSGQKHTLQSQVGGLKKQVEVIKSSIEASAADIAALQLSRETFSDQRQAAFSQIAILFDQVKMEIDKANLDGDQITTSIMNGYLIYSDGLKDNAEMANMLFWRGQALRDQNLIKDTANKMDSVAQALTIFSQAELPPELRSIITDLEKSVPASQNALGEFIEKWSKCEVNNQALDALIEEAERGVADLYQQVEDLTESIAVDTQDMVFRALTAAFIGLGLMLLSGVLFAVLITRSITASIKKTIRALMGEAEQVDRNAASLAEAADQLARGATENAASLSEISTALEELEAMTSRNSEHAAEANGLMSQSRQAARHAEVSMATLSGAMEEISGYGGEIGKIIKVIDEIAFQTNLLALNAAVEAARAGEAGAGFAVVADEVRNLAGRSAEAARNTAALIDSTIKSIDSGSVLVKSTGEDFSSMVTGLGQVGQLVSSVAQASQEQFQGLKSIETAMRGMEVVTQETSATAEQSAAAGEDLTLQSSSMLEAVDQLSLMIFKAGRGYSSAPGRKTYRPKLISG